jgi:hypothetical protein
MHDTSGDAANCCSDERDGSVGLCVPACLMGAQIGAAVLDSLPRAGLGECLPARCQSFRL